MSANNILMNIFIFVKIASEKSTSQKAPYRRFQ